MWLSMGRGDSRMPETGIDLISQNLSPWSICNKSGFIFVRCCFKKDNTPNKSFSVSVASLDQKESVPDRSP